MKTALTFLFLGFFFMFSSLCFLVVLSIIGGNYRITQHIYYDQFPGVESPYIQTLVWVDDDIVKTWYDHIDSDSVSKNAKKRGEDWIKMLKANQ